jgi:sec-independent protein translocase protein TatA
VQGKRALTTVSAKVARSSGTRDLAGTRNADWKTGFRLEIKEDSVFEGLLQPMHLIVIFGIALLVLGPKKLPELGKGLGESIRGFKAAMTPTDEKKDSLDD